MSNQEALHGFVQFQRPGAAVREESDRPSRGHPTVNLCLLRNVSTCLRHQWRGAVCTCRTRRVVLLGSRYAMRPKIGFSCRRVSAVVSVVSAAVIVQITRWKAQQRLSER